MGEFVPAVIAKVTPVETSAVANSFNVTVPLGMALVVLQVIVAVVSASKTGISQEVATLTAVPVDGVLTRTTLSVVSLEATVKPVPVPVMLKAYPIEGHPSVG